MNGDGVDDFVMIDALIQDEDGNPPDADDIRRWAEGELPRYGINGWADGDHETPVVSDGDWGVTRQWTDGSISLPTNIIIGADFVIDFVEAGWGGSLTTAARCCIEKNLCETLPSDFVIPSTGTRCDDPFDCQYTRDGTNWIPVCQN